MGAISIPLNLIKPKKDAYSRRHASCQEHESMEKDEREPEKEQEKAIEEAEAEARMREQ